MIRKLPAISISLSTLWALPLLAATGEGEAAHAAEVAAHGESSGVSPYAYTLFGSEDWLLPITNSMVTSWVISLLLILVIRSMMGKAKMIPNKGQAVVESMVNGIKGIIEPIVGKSMVRPTFPLLIGLFTFILIHNWSGLIPGVGAFGLYGADGHLKYWMRPANADLNTTIALAIVHFVAWFYFIMKYAGPGTVLFDIFGNKADKKTVPAPIYALLFLMFIFVGMIEIVSIIFRNISLPFRLFGNVFGGENLLTAMTQMAHDVGLFGVVIPIPFYFLELLIGLVQALVFTLLVAVYIGLICNHDSGDHAHAH